MCQFEKVNSFLNDYAVLVGLNRRIIFYTPLGLRIFDAKNT